MIIEKNEKQLMWFLYVSIVFYIVSEAHMKLFPCERIGEVFCRLELKTDNTGPGEAVFAIRFDGKLTVGRK